MKYLSMFTFTCFISWGTAFTQPDHHHHSDRDKAKLDSLSKTYPLKIKRLIKQFMTTADSLEWHPDGEDTVKFDPRGFYEVLLVTKRNNPFLSEACREEAMDFATKSIGKFKGYGASELNKSLIEAEKHMKEHEIFINENKMSYAEYLLHLAECQEFCGPLVATLIKCHVLAVARHEHNIVLFALKSYYVEPEYRRGIIAEFARDLQVNRNKKVLLIGHASKIGGMLYNRRLSGQRALAVKDELVAQGIAESRIETMWCGLEPPQIEDWIAKEYGLEDLFHKKGEPQMNQSVEIVLY